MYYKECKLCGAHLDPEEDCDCEIVCRRNKKIRNRHCDNLFEYVKELEDVQDERITV